MSGKTDEEARSRSALPIVVGVDGSRFSLAALAWALDEADRRGCPVRAVMAWPGHSAALAGRPTTVGLPGRLSAELEDDYLRRLTDAVQEVTGDTRHPALTAELVLGPATEALVKASEHAQLLVLGSHGHGAVFEALLGSVTLYCSRHSACPVVVIPGRLVARGGAAEHAQHAPVLRAEGEPVSYGLGPLL